jgi:hypothetical protein
MLPPSRMPSHVVSLLASRLLQATHTRYDERHTNMKYKEYGHNQHLLYYQDLKGKQATLGQTKFARTKPSTHLLILI